MGTPFNHHQLEQVREVSGAQAAAIIGLAQLGDTVCVADAWVASPAEWSLHWPTLHGAFANTLFDLTLAWQELDAVRLQSVPLRLFRHGERVLPDSGAIIDGSAVGCWLHTPTTLQGLLLLWPFRTPDRATLARFRAESACKALAHRWAATARRDHPSSASYMAVFPAMLGEPLVGVEDEHHPLHHPGTRQAALQAIERMKPYQTDSQCTVNGWHLRFRRVTDEAVAVRMTPLAPVPLPPTHILAPQQRRVASMAVAGDTVNDIANALDVAPQTVRSHLKRVYSLLNASNRVELANMLRGSPFHALSS